MKRNGKKGEGGLDNPSVNWSFGKERRDKCKKGKLFKAPLSSSDTVRHQIKNFSSISLSFVGLSIPLAGCWN